MWQLIKSELKYNKDFLIPLVIGILMYMTIQYFFTIVLEQQMFLSGTTLIQGSLFITVFLRIRISKEKRDRFTILLPLSVRKIALARLIIYTIYLAAMWGIILIIHGLSLLFFFYSVFSISAYIALTGTATIFTAIFLMILPGLNGTIRRDSTFFKIPLRMIFKVVQFILAVAAIFIYLPIISAIQNFTGVEKSGFFFNILGSTYLHVMNSLPWAMSLLLLGVILFAIALWIFEKRHSYCE